MRIFKTVPFVISILFIYCTLILSNIYAAEITYNPTSNFYVNDFANILDANVEESVLDTCVGVEQASTAQLVVVTVPNMNGLDIETFSNELFNKWGIGNADKDNGVLIVIAKQERKIRIEVGYGLEGAINDAKAGRILDNVAIPYLKNDDYNTGVLNVVTELKGIIYNEYGIEGGYDNYNEEETSNDSDFMLIPVFILMLIVLLNSIFRRKRYRLLGRLWWLRWGIRRLWRRTLWWRWTFRWRRFLKRILVIKESEY